MESEIKTVNIKNNIKSARDHQSNTFPTNTPNQYVYSSISGDFFLKYGCLNIQTPQNQIKIIVIFCRQQLQMLKHFGLEQSDEGNTSKYGSANQYM